jgi:hypothetical protein
MTYRSGFGRARNCDVSQLHPRPTSLLFCYVPALPFSNPAATDVSQLHPRPTSLLFCCMCLPSHFPILPLHPTGSPSRATSPGLAYGPLGAPGERQDDEERGRLPPPVHRLLRSALYREPVPHGPAAHSITSSARARIVWGTVRPSALAVFRLTTSSNFVGCGPADRPAWHP